MISAQHFHEELRRCSVEFFAGVPDSLLAPLCAVISDNAPAGHHVVTANEGSAVALAVGYHLATGRTPAVYLQNSGLGNVINPLLSLADPAVYDVPILFIIGWRGEPGVPDEPQHVTQGRLSPALLETLGVPCDVLGADSAGYAGVLRRACAGLAQGGPSHALLIRKGTFEAYEGAPGPVRTFPLTREQALEVILPCLDERDVLVSTTGMTSREIFDYRTRTHAGHHRDFLVVGSMGHCSQIALGIAQHAPSRTVYCIDGDGAVIMHMGGLAVIGSQQPRNFRHIVLNNGAHDSVGGQPTAGLSIDIPAIAAACGYSATAGACTAEEIHAGLRAISEPDGPTLLEVRVRTGARPDLGRPTTTPRDNKRSFMKALRDA